MTDGSPPTDRSDGHPIATGEWTDRLFEHHDPPAAYDGETGAAFDRWQAETRDRLRGTLGHTVIERAGRCDLDSELVATADAGDRERQTWTIESKPGFRVPFYLLVPDDADPLAVVGHSGGGTVALFAAALDTGLAPVVVSSYLCALEDSIAAVDHCTCNYVPGLLELGEIWNVAGLIAPRPLGVLAGRHDEIFPLGRVRRAVENLRPIYEAASAPGAVDLCVGDGGHRFFEDAAWSFVVDCR